ncbi:hypothetical protein Q5H91_03660 [Sphingomonas sp. KR1UV-12]|uniref:Uncharacterized protein n=1 Tax=Sphingomonas aurea TaxID=3063994 RepID=A0ABT9EH56_9SPHN|nr:hypothetical protein [Sphingomonas sp. KR1UV-12]MDP1026297.1 hypothetical protein [Sphingomonas sp. KR1UV-12]
MMFKGVTVLALLIFAGGYFLGAFGPQPYARTVARPPADVMLALEQLDLTAQPGAPGSTAEAAGGVKPLFRLEKGEGRMTWYVMSGDKVATSMTAMLEPIEGGKATRVQTSVKRGDAPDDLVSPAFRSEGLTTALFSMAIEGVLNKLTAPTKADAETCQRILYGSGSNGEQVRPKEGIAAIMHLNAMEQELRRNGCDTNEDGAFRSVEEQTASPDASSGDDALSLPRSTPNQSGQPMLDPTPQTVPGE